jgi:hypothetical protein
MSANAAVKVGDVVRFTLGITLATGKVIEDRGPIGLKGRHLYRVRYGLGPEFTAETELPAEKLEVVRDEAQVG